MLAHALLTWLAAVAPPVNLATAQQLLADGDAQRAEQMYRDLASTYRAEALAGRARALMRLGRLREAIDECEAFLTLGLPGSDVVWRVNDELQRARTQDTDTAPPLLGHEPIATSLVGETVTIIAELEDPAGIFLPLVHYRLVGSGSYTAASMQAGPGGTYQATIGPFEQDFEYFVEAFDMLGNGPARAGTPAYPLSVTVHAEAPAENVPMAVEAAPVENLVEEPPPLVAGTLLTPEPPAAALSPYRIGGYVTLGAAAVAAGVALVYGLRALDAASDWRAARDARAWSAARERATSSSHRVTAGVIAAAALSSGGAALLILHW